MGMKACKECGNNISTKADKCPHCGFKNKKSSTLFVLILVLIIAWSFSKVFESTPPPLNPTTAIAGVQVAPTPPSPYDQAAKDLKLDFDWRTAGRNDVMIADIKIKNNSKYTVKDIIIKCTLYANSGTMLGKSEKTVYEILKPGKGFSLKNANMGFINPQTASASCRIPNFELIGQNN